MSASLGLYRLQVIDRRMDRVLFQLDSVRKTLDDDAELRNAFDKVRDAKVQHEAAQKAMRTAEAAAQSQGVKIQQAEASLYGGQVHNPKELQDLQKDVASLKRHLSTLEEHELEAMLGVEHAEKGVLIAAAELETLQASLDARQKDLLASQGDLERELGKLTEERQATVNALPAGQLFQYENLRRDKRGLAVAEVLDNSCSACGATLTAAIQQNAHSPSRLVPCPTCSRILYAA